MADPETIRIFIVDDHAVLRSGLRLLLEKQGDMEVVGEAESGEQAMMLDAKLQPDILLRMSRSLLFGSRSIAS